MSHFSSSPPRGAHIEELSPDADPESVLEAEEDADDVIEHHQEIEHDIDLGLDQQHQQANEEMMRMFIRSLAEAQQSQSQPSQQLTPYQPDEDEEDEEDDQPQPPDTFFSWLRSSLPTLSSTRVLSFSRLQSLRAGRWLWNLSTAGMLLMLPYILATSAEEQKIVEANMMMQMEARVNWLEGGGGGGMVGGYGGVGGMGGGVVEVPASAPPGYVPPPMEASGIPPPGRY